MADEAYRAVFLRVHPTGKMVLSLTTESDQREADYARLVAAELGVPALDVKVVPADTDRFGDRPRLQQRAVRWDRGGDRDGGRPDPRQGAAAGRSGDGGGPGEPRPGRTVPGWSEKEATGSR